MKISISRFWKETLSLIAMEVGFYVLFFIIMAALIDVGVTITFRMFGIK